MPGFRISSGDSVASEAEALESIKGDPGRESDWTSLSSRHSAGSATKEIGKDNFEGPILEIEQEEDEHRTASCCLAAGVPELRTGPAAPKEYPAEESEDRELASLVESIVVCQEATSLLRCIFSPWRDAVQEAVRQREIDAAQEQVGGV